MYIHRHFKVKQIESSSAYDKKTVTTSQELGLTEDKSFDYRDMVRQFGGKTEINITYSLSYNPE